MQSLPLTDLIQALKLARPTDSKITDSFKGKYLHSQLFLNFLTGFKYRTVNYTCKKSSRPMSLIIFSHPELSKDAVLCCQQWESKTDNSTFYQKKSLQYAIDHVLKEIQPKNETAESTLTESQPESKSTQWFKEQIAKIRAEKADKIKKEFIEVPGFSDEI
jgi:hypothetical protein